MLVILPFKSSFLSFIAANADMQLASIKNELSSRDTALLKMICNKQHPNVYCTINLDLLRIKEIQLKKVALYLAFQFIISFRSFKTLLKIHNSPRKFVLQGRSFLCQPENDEGEKSNTV